MLDAKISDFFSTELLSLLVVRCSSSDWSFDSFMRHLMVLWLICSHMRDRHFGNWMMIIDLSHRLGVMLLSGWGSSFGCIMRSRGTVVMRLFSDMAVSVNGKLNVFTNTVW